MYTVLRFCELSYDQVQSLGLQIEKLLPGIFSGPDEGCPNRVSIPLAEGDDWDLHVNSIIAKVTLLDEVITAMQKTTETTELDIAIEPEDCKSLLSEFAFPFEFLALLVSKKIVLITSIYG